MRIEGRLHGSGFSAPDLRIASVGPLGLYLTGGMVYVANYYDALAGDPELLPIPDSADILWRIQRDVPNNRQTLELCIVGGACQSKSRTVTAFANTGNGFTTGIATGIMAGTDFGVTAGNLAFLRWCTGTVPAGTPVSIGQGSCSNLGDWELTNNRNDSSGHGLNLSGGSTTYVSTPIYEPKCDAGPSKTLVAGYRTELDGSRSASLDEVHPTLTYQWQQMAGMEGPRVLWLSAQNAASPAIEPPLLGSYQFQLVVTDTGGLSAICSVKHGAVAVDENSAVLTGNEDFNRVTGSLIASGKNPWPWFDERHEAWAKHLGELLLTDPTLTDDWNTALSGTISVTNGSTVVTGTGTDFQNSFCNGGMTGGGENSKLLVVWYPRPGGGFGKRAYGVGTCDSATQITLTRAYSTSPGASGSLQYSLFVNLGAWINGSNNINYYDNVLAFYSLFHRSGNETYRNYARTLADRWWTMPFMDEGWGCLDGWSCLAPRSRALTGMFMRALDGAPELWPGLRLLVDNHRDSIASNITLNFPIIDIREEGYALAFVALCGMLDPDAVHREQCQNSVSNAVAQRWLPMQKTAPGGTKYWDNFIPGSGTFSGQAGTVTVTAGSSHVQGVGTSWTNDTFKSMFGTGPLLDTGQGAKFLWTSNTTPGFPQSCVPGFGNLVTGDSIVYRVLSLDVSTQTLTISPSYAGPSGSGHGWGFSQLQGCGTQPFMMGVVGAAMNYAYWALKDVDVMNSNRAKQMLLDSVHWVIARGIWSLDGSTDFSGLFYAREFPGCEPNPQLMLGCRGTDSADSSPGSIQASRFLAAEIMHAFSDAYAISQDPSILAAGDLLYGRLYGGSGGPNSDANYLHLYLNDNSFDFVTNKWKDFGFFAGWGMGAAWPGVRNGPSTVTSAQIALPFTLDPYPGAVKVRVTITRPTGAQSQVVCTASPCILTIDARLGDNVAKVEYLTNDDTVVATTQPAISLRRR